jgi:hypothetical protein
MRLGQTSPPNDVYPTQDMTKVLSGPVSQIIIECHNMIVVSKDAEISCVPCLCLAFALQQLGKAKGI